ncbi:MAG: helix-turn-helix transcriptional regulator [Vulcanimicrobiaceae bacterium]
MTPHSRSRLDRADAMAIEALAVGDPARDLIAEILSVVRVSHWSFGRFGSNGPSDQLFVPGKPDDERAELEYLREELVLQRERTAKGPRLAATLTSFQKPYVSGITLVFADMRREFGILSLLRTDDLKPFTSVEIQALALALDASTDRLSGLSIAEPSPQTEPLDAFDQSTMHVLDRDLKVVLTWDADEGRSASITALHARLAQRLPPIIEDTVRELIETWTGDPATQGRGVAHPVPFLTVRTQPLSGPTGLFVGVVLQRAPGGQIFNKAALAFNLSPRELQTLALLLQGATLNEVALAMSITPSTVQDHIKSMLDKTGSRNRSELIAKLLSPRNGP